MPLRLCLCILLLLSAHSATIAQCKHLALSMASADRIDRKSDAEFGVGDDDLFTGDELTIKQLDGKAIEALYDYNLTTVYSFRPHGNVSSDTLLVRIYFAGLPIAKKPVVQLKEISSFNGNRASLEAWRKSLKAGLVEVFYKNRCLGKSTLQSTFKMQTMLLPGTGLSIFGQQALELLLVIHGQRNPKQTSTGFQLSEIQFGGQKMFD